MYPIIGKSRDYFYGMCQYKVLSIKSYFKVKSFKMKNNRQNLGYVKKTWKKKCNKSIENPLHLIKMTHQLSFRNINIKVAHHAEWGWFIYSPKHHKDNQLLLLSHYCQVFLVQYVNLIYTIPHLPGCFCPLTFFKNIRFNMVPSDPFMSHLATKLGYSAGEFQALQLIVLAAFGVVD